jgi:hypothetical protein
MNKEFIPYEQALELKELGFNELCSAFYQKDLGSIYQHYAGFDIRNDDVYYNNYKLECTAALYQQAFRWFREKYNFRYSIGNTNIAVVHYGPITQLLQDNESYEAAELAAIKWFIDTAKQS